LDGVSEIEMVQRIQALEHNLSTERSEIKKQLAAESIGDALDLELLDEINSTAEVVVAELPDWVRVNLHGELPDKRTQHCAFILDMSTGRETLFIQGGRDLVKGFMQSMWKLDLTSVRSLVACQWKELRPNGRGPGAISNHTASALNQT